MTNGSAMIQRSRLDRWGALYARMALRAAFLSAVAGRFGLWQRTATVAETTLGILLIVGLWPRWVSLASAILLGMFGLRW